MDLQANTNELTAFSVLVGHLAAQGEQLSREEATQAFREKQDQLARLKTELQPSIEELEAGGGKDLDLDGIWSSVKQQLASEGIND